MAAKSNTKQAKPKQWLTCFEVCRFFHISPNALQQLLSNGVVSTANTKGIIYYFLEDVEVLIEGGRL